MVETSLVLVQNQLQIRGVILIWLQVMQSGQGQGFPKVADKQDINSDLNPCESESGIVHQDSDQGLRSSS